MIQNIKENGLFKTGDLFYALTENPVYDSLKSKTQNNFAYGSFSHLKVWFSFVKISNDNKRRNRQV